MMHEVDSIECANLTMAEMDSCQLDDGVSIEPATDNDSQTLRTCQEVSRTAHLERESGNIHRVSSQPSLTINNATREYRSTPTPYSSFSSVSSDGLENQNTRSRFEKRNIWSNSRQESFELPDDLNTCTEDNVFYESGSRRSYTPRRRMAWQRSVSVPASLPDVVQVASTYSGYSSPDVLVKGESEDSYAGDLNLQQSDDKLTSADCDNIDRFRSAQEEDKLPSEKVQNAHRGAKLSVDVSSCSGACSAFACEDAEESCCAISDVNQDIHASKDKASKQMFEGTTCYNPPQKRRKSVSFDTSAEFLRMVSAQGQKARTHFRSSGYGSQSESSQHSQKSDATSCEGSVMSDDVLLERSSSDLSSMERSSFETGFGGSTDQDCDNLDQQSSATDIDGSIDGNEKEAKNRGSRENSSSDNSQTLSGSTIYNFGAVGGTAENCLSTKFVSETFEVGLANYDNDNIPVLSIFDNISIGENSDGSVGCSNVAWEDFSYHRNHILENSEIPEERGSYPQLPFQQAEPSSNTVGAFSAQRSRPESPTERFSPTSVQRELYEKMFLDKMANFDPTVAGESVSDLLNWFIDNLPQALSPSPRSPFFPADGSPHNLRLAQRIATALGLELESASRLVPSPAGAEGIQVSPRTVQTHSALATSTIGDQLMRLTVQSRDQSQDQSKQPTIQPQQPTFQPSLLTEAVCPLRTAMAEVGSFSRSDSSVGLLDSSLGTGVSDSDLERVLRLSQCNHNRCTDQECVMWRRRVQSLRDEARRGENLSPDNRSALKVLCGHYQYCDQLNCMVPWCRLICRSQKGRNITLQAAVSILTSPMITLLPPYFRATRFLKLNPECPLNEMPQEWEHWLTLSPLSHSHSVVRAIPLMNDNPGKHWTVKLTCLHEGQNQPKVLKSLCSLQNPHVVPHLWAAIDTENDLLVVCTEFHNGISLKEILSTQSRLEYSQTLKYLWQILTALEHLHQQKIVYLNWASSNILLDSSCQRVKMTNFTSCVHLPFDSADSGDVKLSLPADIVPPELMVCGGEITENSDSWGVACVVHEMLTGWRPWQHFRHHKQDDVWRQIKRQVHPNMSSEIPHCMQLLLSGCFKRCPKERLSTEDLLHNVQLECHSSLYPVQ